MRAGNVIAFGVEGAKGRETLVVVAEMRSDDHDTVRTEVHHRVMEVSGVPPHEVLLVAPGSLPEDVVGQAAAQRLPRALPRRRAAAGLIDGGLPHRDDQPTDGRCALGVSPSATGEHADASARGRSCRARRS